MGQEGVKTLSVNRTVKSDSKGNANMLQMQWETWTAKLNQGTLSTFHLLDYSTILPRSEQPRGGGGARLTVPVTVVANSFDSNALTTYFPLEKRSTVRTLPRRGGNICIDEAFFVSCMRQTPIHFHMALLLLFPSICFFLIRSNGKCWKSIFWYLRVPYHTMSNKAWQELRSNLKALSPLR